MSEIRELAMAEPLFDNHEHQRGYAEIEEQKAELDFRAFLGYAGADMVTASPGMSPEEAAPDTFFATWDSVRTTGYGQAAELACKAMLGLDFTRANADEITDALRHFVRELSGAQIYADLYAMANVRWAVCDACWDSPTSLEVFTGRDHPEFFGQALRCDDLIHLASREQVQELEKVLDHAVQRLSDLDAAMDGYAEKARQGGRLTAFKCGVAYRGHLDFQNSSYCLAEPVFEDLMQGRPVDRRPLADYLFHRFIQRAREFDLPVQVHTGYLAGNWKDIRQGDPAPLIPVFQRYPKVRFDLFHAGWPYSELMGAIGKEFPNVYLDMCWAWAMNPAAMERVLSEWLAAVPHNKVFAFGADIGTPYPVPGYAGQARNGVANVLERKVESGEYDVGTARRVAARIMHENAREFYRLA